MSGDALQITGAAPFFGGGADAPDLPEGYGRTEVGLLPREWKVSDLGAICSFENGDRSANYPSAGSFAADGVPFINAGHLDGGRIELREMDYITQAAFDRLGGGKVHCGDILFCLRGTLGKFGVVGSVVGKGAIASSLVIVRPRSRDLLRQFLACYFASDLCSRMIEKWAGGAAQPNLGAQDLARFSIALPPIPEQRAIVEAVSDVDGLLDALEALIAKKRAIKQAAMQQLLTGKTRLPGFSGEWQTKSLAEVCALKSGATITSARIDGHSVYPCYGGNGLRGFTSTFTHDGAHALIGRQGALCGNVVGVSGKFYASEHALVVTSTQTTDIHWLTFLLSRMQLNRFSESSAQPGLSAVKLLLLQIACPPTKAEQAAIATILSDIDAEIAALETRRDKTRAIKQAMMQQLLTGRVRLVAPTPPPTTAPR